MKHPNSALPLGVTRKSVFSVPVSSSQLHESIWATLIAPAREKVIIREFYLHLCVSMECEDAQV